MRLGDRVFRAGLAPTVATLVMMPMLIGLGLWQLDRAEQKRALQHQFEQGEETTLEIDDTLDTPVETLRYRRIELSGRYDTRRQFLLDNIVQQGRVGYHVLTPLALDGHPARVLVNRGWVPAQSRRERLPDVSLQDEPQSISGRIDRLPRPGLRLRAEPTGGWPRVVQFPEIDELERALGGRLLGFQVLLDADAPNGYTRDWRPTEFGPMRHVAYAVQWFALAATLVVIFVALSIKRVGHHD